MKNNVLWIKAFSNQELLDELALRLGSNCSDIPVPPTLQDMVGITPYEIISRMIEQGWEEDPKKGKTDPRIKKLWAYVGYPNYDDDTAYCAATVNACLKLAGYEMSESVPASRSFESYGKAVVLSDAQEGDIVHFQKRGSSWAGHVGFLQEKLPNTIIVSGGNQSNKMCDKEYSYAGSSLVVEGYRRITEMNRVGEPDWETLREWDLLI